MLLLHRLDMVGLLKYPWLVALKKSVNRVDHGAALVSGQAALYGVVNLAGIGFGDLWSSGEVAKVLQRFGRSWPVVWLLACAVVAVLLLLLRCYRRAVLLRLARAFGVAILLAKGRPLFALLLVAVCLRFR